MRELASCRRSRSGLHRTYWLARNFPHNIEEGLKYGRLSLAAINDGTFHFGNWSLQFAKDDTPSGQVLYRRRKDRYPETGFYEGERRINIIHFVNDLEAEPRTPANADNLVVIARTQRAGK